MLCVTGGSGECSKISTEPCAKGRWRIGRAAEVSPVAVESAEAEMVGAACRREVSFNLGRSSRGPYGTAVPIALDSCAAAPVSVATIASRMTLARCPELVCMFWD